MKIAVISPYYKESTEVLRRCHDSVVNQSIKTEHFMVADGHPNSEVDAWDATHLKVPTHGDFGDTPRALGSFSAATLGADAICFLDGDNWLEPDHIEVMLKRQNETGAHVVTATRNLRRLDGSLLGVCTESDGNNFNDTNCYFITKPAFCLIGAWLLKDKRNAITGDRIFWATIKQSNFWRAHSIIPTVNYTTNFACHYQQFGENPADTTKVIVRFQGQEFSQTVSFGDYKKIVSGQMSVPNN